MLITSENIFKISSEAFLRFVFLNTFFYKNCIKNMFQVECASFANFNGKKIYNSYSMS